MCGRKSKIKISITQLSQLPYSSCSSVGENCVFLYATQKPDGDANAFTRAFALREGVKMEYIESSNFKKYGVVFKVTPQGITCHEEYHCGEITVKLPIGELMLDLVESIDVFNNDGDHDKELSVDQECVLGEILNGFSVKQADYKGLLQVKDYLTLIAENKINFNYRTLSELYFKILPCHHPFFYLFDSSNRYRIRQVLSKVQVPFGCTTYQILKVLEEKYTHFSFHTATEINTLPELCALSLFEIYESGQIIRRCSLCNRFFITDESTSYCNRSAPFNDFRGCKKQKTANYNRQYRTRNSVKEYKKIYNRLQSRARRPCPTVNDVKTFKEFQNEWASLRINYRQSDDFEDRKLSFLKLERWK